MRRETIPDQRGWSGMVGKEDPGDNRLSRRSTIMGPTGLTAVFGMGTGVTPPVSSPGIQSRGRSGHHSVSPGCSVTAGKSVKSSRVEGRVSRISHTGGTQNPREIRGRRGVGC